MQQEWQQHTVMFQLPLADCVGCVMDGDSATYTNIFIYNSNF